MEISWKMVPPRAMLAPKLACVCDPDDVEPDAIAAPIAWTRREMISSKEYEDDGISSGCQAAVLWTETPDDAAQQDEISSNE